MKVEPRELKLKAATEGAQMEKKKFFGDLSVILAGAVMFAVGNVLHHLSMDMWALPSPETQWSCRFYESHPNRHPDPLRLPSAALLQR